MGLGTTELIIIFGIILLVFGAGKIPKVARDLGSGIKEFKKSLSGEITEDNSSNQNSSNQSEKTAQNSNQQNDKKS